jgi:3-dehydroquinate dehydratase/shikimate dehydrogenase
MIIVSITGPGMKEALAQVASSTRYADLLEFRLDLIREAELGTLLLSTRLPVIATCRPSWEGGNFRGGERERIKILSAASLLGASYVDLEMRTSRGLLHSFLGNHPETRVILSYHASPGSSVLEREVYREMRTMRADVVKFAFYAEDAYQNSVAFDFLRRAKVDRQRAVAIAMGEAGEPSRVLYRVFGGWATYASALPGSESAPGQIPARQLREMYRAETLTPSTKIFGVIGNPIGQSKGVFVHNPLFVQAGLNSVYCRFLVRDLPRFMKKIAPLLGGFSVTIPHKEHVMRFLDSIDPRAAEIGAVNTVVRRKSGLWGTNTDAPGALDAIERVTQVKGKSVLILGAGGAAMAIAFEAKRRGAYVIIANRTEGKAKKVSSRLGVSWIPVRSIGSAQYDIVVNATSVGMTPHVHATPLAARYVKGKIVFDAVYNPSLTRFLREARRVRARNIPGTEMYLNQGIRQFRLYSGIDPDRKAMRNLIFGRG